MQSISSFRSVQISGNEPPTVEELDFVELLDRVQTLQNVVYRIKNKDDSTFEGTIYSALGEYLHLQESIEELINKFDEKLKNDPKLFEERLQHAVVPTNIIDSARDSQTGQSFQPNVLEDSNLEKNTVSEEDSFMSMQSIAWRQPNAPQVPRLNLESSKFQSASDLGAKDKLKLQHQGSDWIFPSISESIPGHVCNEENFHIAKTQFLQIQQELIGVMTPKTKSKYEELTTGKTSEGMLLGSEFALDSTRLKKMEEDVAELQHIAVDMEKDFVVRAKAKEAEEREEKLVTQAHIEASAMEKTLSGAMAADERGAAEELTSFREKLSPEEQEAFDGLSLEEKLNMVQEVNEYKGSFGEDQLKIEQYRESVLSPEELVEFDKLKPEEQLEVMNEHYEKVAEVTAAAVSSYKDTLDANKWEIYDELPESEQQEALECVALYRNSLGESELWAFDKLPVIEQLRRAQDSVDPSTFVDEVTAIEDYKRTLNKHERKMFESLAYAEQSTIAGALEKSRANAKANDLTASLENEAAMLTSDSALISDSVMMSNDSESPRFGKGRGGRKAESKKDQEDNQANKEKQEKKTTAETNREILSQTAVPAGTYGEAEMSPYVMEAMDQSQAIEVHADNEMDEQAITQSIIYENEEVLGTTRRFSNESDELKPTDSTPLLEEDEKLKKKSKCSCCACCIIM